MVEEQTLIALYKTIEAAERTRERLMAAGVPGGQVTISGEEVAGSTADYSAPEGGFFQTLKEMFLPESDHYTYAEGVRRGAKMVSVRLPAAMAAEALRIMEAADPIDIEASASEWREAGWGDYGRSAKEDRAAAEAAERRAELRRIEAEHPAKRTRIYAR